MIQDYSVSALPKKACRVFTGIVLRGMEIAAQYSEGDRNIQMLREWGEIVSPGKDSFFRVIRRI